MTQSEPEATEEDLIEAMNVVLDALNLSMRALSGILAHEGAWPGAEFVLSAPEYDRLARHFDTWKYHNG